MTFPVRLFVCLAVLVFLIFPVRAAVDRSDLRGADLLKADLIGVFAHPDDETGMAPTLAHYALGQDKRVVNIYATRGEGGGNMVGRQWGPSLGLLRESELRQCLTMLGVERVYFLDQRDWAYTESAQMTLEVWDRAAALEKLVRLFRALRPDVVATMNPTPRPGQHGHHQAAGILAIEAFNLAADPKAFPNQLRDEGLDPWQPRKLYIGGSPDPFGATIPSTAKLPDGRTVAGVAGKALSHHRSQGFGRMADAPWLARPRSYRLLKSVVGYTSSEEDLFLGLETGRNLSEVAGIPEAPGRPAESTWRFAARPALESFRAWAKAQGVGVLADSLDADAVVPVGMTRVIALRRAGAGQEPFDWETATVSSPEKWTGQLKKDQSGNPSLSVTAPAGELSEGRFEVTWTGGKDGVDVHSVPVARVPKISMTRLTWDDANWKDAALLEIPHTRTWQGKVDDAADNSGLARVGYGDGAFYIRVQVRDETVVSNIEPNDIRGHWRSDSVEVCLDPEGGAPHTLGTFKAGIFPFDRTGKVRAARDADANQGPIERTAPGMELISRRTKDGYEVAMKIPGSVVGTELRSGQGLAFNLLIYDGDKADADPGENINQSRLAWSPRRGVQGRPEDWGRIVLE